MNENLSILLATTILAIGGIGLYLYKTSDKERIEYNEKELFDKKDNIEDDTISESSIEIEQCPSSESLKEYKQKNKTKKNKKNGGTKRRY
jgi:hypothetical protein